MAFFGKDYKVQNDKDENFDAFLKGVGLPDEKVKVILSSKSSIKISKNGDGYTLTQSGAIGEKNVNFKSGVEFDDTIGEDKVPIKTAVTVDGNTVTQIIKSGMGSATFKREYNGDDMILTITSDKFSGVSKRFYKA